MSRTKKGKKPPGAEYTGKRALSWCYATGSDVKKLSSRIERARLKEDLLKEPLTPEYDEREWVPDEVFERERIQSEVCEKEKK